MESIKNLLIKKQKKVYNYKKNREYSFYKRHRYLLKSFPQYTSFIDIYNSFEMICANSIIYSILNKKKLDDICKDLFSSIFLNNKLTSEEFIKYYQSRIIDLRFFVSNDIKVYIPIFSHVINEIYYKEPTKLLEVPYNELFSNYTNNLIDPFDTYGLSLFDSNFTKLVLVKKYDNNAVFYDFDLATVYIINDQGRLDYEIHLFDKWMEKINTSRILDRIINVTDAYFSNNKSLFIENMYTQGLISQKMFETLNKKFVNE